MKLSEIKNMHENRGKYKTGLNLHGAVYIPKTLRPCECALTEDDLRIIICLKKVDEGSEKNTFNIGAKKRKLISLNMQTVTSEFIKSEVEDGVYYCTFYKAESPSW